MQITCICDYTYIQKSKVRIQELDIGPKFNPDVFFTGPEASLTNYAGLKERAYETMSVAFGFGVMLKN